MKLTDKKFTELAQATVWCFLSLCVVGALYVVFVSNERGAENRFKDAPLCSLNEIQLGQTYTLDNRPYELINTTKKDKVTEEGVGKDKITFTTEANEVILFFERMD